MLKFSDKRQTYELASYTAPTLVQRTLRGRGLVVEKTCQPNAGTTSLRSSRQLTHLPWNPSTRMGAQTPESVTELNGVG
jgi:hypothetical protein